MNSQATGTVISASKQWWLKVNVKPFRKGTLDGATFPYVIKVKYTANGTDYVKRRWISAGKPVPRVGSTITVAYDEKKPKKAKILL